MPEALHMARGHPSELVRVQRGEVGQGITREVGPEDLDGVELRGVRRQQDGEPLAVMQVGGNHLSAMPGQAIPDVKAETRSDGPCSGASVSEYPSLSHATSSFSFANGTLSRNVCIGVLP